jgi:hypothetical protein
MSTRCLIGALHSDGHVSAIYCHSDGYPEHVGRLLARHYATPARLAALQSLGDLSELGERLTPAEGVAHSFAERSPGVCVAYSRDRGDKASRPIGYDSVDEYLARSVANHSWIEWAYLFDAGSGWWCVSKERPDECRPLARALDTPSLA